MLLAAYLESTIGPQIVPRSPICRAAFVLVQVADTVWLVEVAFGVSVDVGAGSLQAVSVTINTNKDIAKEAGLRFII